ncbi:MAG: glycosyltransferase family 4 protein [Bacteroidota bacterium]|nr:glycosyltransferase family 4 protein [Bacteroidota bacterium]
MKIFALVSYPFLPATTGGEISTLQLLNHLGMQHQVKVYTVEPYAPIDPKELHFEALFHMRFKPQRYLNIFLPFTLAKHIKAQASDVIFLDQPFMGWMIPLLQLLTRKKVFVRCHNIEYLRFKSMGKSWWSLMYMYEKMVHQMADLVIYLSEVDKEHAQVEFNLNPNKTALVPTGIAYSHIPPPIVQAKEMVAKRHGLGLNQTIILYFGTMHYAPNYEGVNYLMSEVYPKLEAALGNNFSLLICGKGLPQNLADKMKDFPQMQYLGFVEDIETYIDAASVLLNPILSGGGVKTKALEGMGRNKTIVSTYTGALGINQEVCGPYLKIAPDDNWTAFTQHILSSLSEQKLPISNAFFDTYAWPGIVKKLSERLQLLLAGK